MPRPLNDSTLRLADNRMAQYRQLSAAPRIQATSVNRLKHYFDPYDLWSQAVIGPIKVAATRGNRLAFAASGAVAILDLVAPYTMRRILGIHARRYTHVDAMLVDVAAPFEYSTFLHHAERDAIPAGAGVGWGYPFDWFSKNAPDGVYPRNTLPYVTITPYVMEALCRRGIHDEQAPWARRLFLKTWGFLEALRVPHETDTEMATSYSPADEPYLVVNASSYAAWAYAMHFAHGDAANSEAARLRAIRLTRWVARQQGRNGHWPYLANSAPGNFVDCFHSCIVIRNLIACRSLLGFLPDEVEDALHRGWQFVRTAFPDPKTGLCRRFLVSKIKDPLYRWDIYDQAEYLGLLVDHDLWDEAVSLRERIRATFSRGDDWYCRVDILGRRWGRNFIRWGIAPYWRHSNRLDAALTEGPD